MIYCHIWVRKHLVEVTKNSVTSFYSDNYTINVYPFLSSPFLAPDFLCHPN